MRNLSDIKKIAFVGLGLLGGSLAKRIREVLPETYLAATARSKSTVEYALREGIIDQSCSDIHQLVYDADLIIIASPLETIVSYVKKIYPLCKESAIITDIGSSKSEIARKLKKYSDKFIAGHPMCGKEVSGIYYAEAAMLDNAVFALTPVKESNQDKIDLLQDLIITLQMRPVVLTPREHDLAVAAISHLPYFSAAALLNNLDSKAQKILAASGFSSSTRVAASDPGWGVEVARSNRIPVLKQLDGLLAELNTIREYIYDEKYSALETYLKKARALRGEIYQ